MPKKPQQLREQPDPQRFLAAKHELLTIYFVFEHQWCLFDGELEKVDCLDALGAYMGPIEEWIVQPNAIQDNASVDVKEHVIVFNTLPGVLRSAGSSLTRWMIAKKPFSSLFSSDLEDLVDAEMFSTSWAARVDGGGPVAKSPPGRP
jgi:hypothetical protein